MPSGAAPGAESPCSKLHLRPPGPRPRPVRDIWRLTTTEGQIPWHQRLSQQHPGPSWTPTGTSTFWFPGETVPAPILPGAPRALGASLLGPVFALCFSRPTPAALPVAAFGKSCTGRPAMGRAPGHVQLSGGFLSSARLRGVCEPPPGPEAAGAGRCLPTGDAQGLQVNVLGTFRAGKAAPWSQTGATFTSQAVKQTMGTVSTTESRQLLK